jgi:hypothetical protein
MTEPKIKNQATDDNKNYYLPIIDWLTSRTWKIGKKAALCKETAFL